MSDEPAVRTALDHPTRIARLIECTVVFLCLPIALTFFRDIVPPIPIVLGIGLLLLIVLLRDQTFDRTQLWNLKPVVPSLRWIVPIWLLSMLVLIAIVWSIRPEALFSFPRERTSIWAIVVTFYPIFSVIPQTIIYRAYFFHRYAGLFGRGWGMVLMSAIAFGFAHMIFKHWLPVALTLVGGLLFSETYRRTRSAPASATAHALFGDGVFTLGLGTFFYHGSQRVVETLAQ
jgi:membrane protease YdiL (CAAX protease family)